MNFTLRKTTITSVQALLDRFDKLPRDPNLLELVMQEEDDGEIEIVDTIPVLVLPDVDFSEYNGAHCDWLESQVEDFDRVYPTDLSRECLEDFLYDGQDLYVITNNNSHNA